MASIQKGDFIELEFSGKLKNGEVFDSNIPSDLSDSRAKSQAKPFVYAVGKSMFLDSIDEFLIGKDIGKEYSLDLTPDKAFGPRDAKLIRLVPMRLFREQNLAPQIGASFNFDNRIGKVISISGGRIMVDFNNPVAGKDVSYLLKPLRKVEEKKEQTDSIMEFFFRFIPSYNIENNKLIVEIDSSLHKVFKMFNDKFKELLNLDLELKEPSLSEKKNAGSNENKIGKEMGKEIQEVAESIEKSN